MTGGDGDTGGRVPPGGPPATGAGVGSGGASTATCPPGPAGGVAPGVGNGRGTAPLVPHAAANTAAATTRFRVRSRPITAGISAAGAIGDSALTILFQGVYSDSSLTPLQASGNIQTRSTIRARAHGTDAAPERFVRTAENRPLAEGDHASVPG